MSREFRLQDPGEGLHEAEIVEVLVAEGDQVTEGDTVLSVETDKATTEIPSPYSGQVERIAVSEGDVAKVGDLLMTFAGDDEAAQQADSEPADEASTEATETGGDEQPEPDEDADTKARAEPERGAEAEAQDEADASGEEKQAAAGGDGAEQAKDEGPVPAAPSTRRLARELDVRLTEVSGSGPGGRVLADDVRAAAEGAPAEDKEAPKEKTEPEQAPEREERRPATRAETGAPAFELPDFSRWGEIERIPLRSVRRATARAMARSWAEVPHVMHHDLADITALEEFRRAHADEIEAAGGKLTLTVLVLKAAVAALKAFPRFNASLDMDDESIVIKHYYHVGVAVDTEQGLLVPVVRDVDRKSVKELSVELVERAERARAGELDRDEMQGGSFTVTNVGGIGGTLFTPIIHHPEVAILGLARAELQPVARGDPDAPELSARLRLPLCLAFDHRVTDGAEAARFVNHIVAALADPERLLLSA
jgi:pyruvate dehydrogenase E2 component (dihydrolipoamide acetyltransferase)